MWAIFALGSALAFCFVSVCDKRLISYHFRGVPPLCLWCGVSGMLYGSILLAILGVPAGLPWTTAAAPVASGILMGCSVVLLFRGLRLMEASRAVAIAQTNPIFVALLAMTFLDERISPFQWGGISLVVAGAILISIRLFQDAPYPRTAPAPGRAPAAATSPASAPVSNPIPGAASSSASGSTSAPAVSNPIPGAVSSPAVPGQVSAPAVPGQASAPASGTASASASDAASNPAISASTSSAATSPAAPGQASGQVSAPASAAASDATPNPAISASTSSAASSPAAPGQASAPASAAASDATSDPAATGQASAPAVPNPIPAAATSPAATNPAYDTPASRRPASAPPDRPAAWHGPALLLVSAMCAGSSFVVAKAALNAGIPTLTVFAMQQTVVGAVFFAAGLTGGPRLLAAVRQPRVLALLLFGESLMPALSILLTIHAYSLGPASLVAAMLATRPLFVFAASTLLSRMRWHLLDENLTPTALCVKGISIVMIVCGAGALSLG